MLAIIGGSGVYALKGLRNSHSENIETAYGVVDIQCGSLSGRPVIFLPRHGAGHKVPPHRINYQANIQALATKGATAIVGTNAVGAIRSDISPGVFVLPDQIIDYTWGRESTFFDAFSEQVVHADLTDPFSHALRGALALALSAIDESYVDGGVYGCVQGPRLETAAEIRRYQRDGCDMVGMTAMPEAALARELQIPYASLSFSVNWAAGIQGPVDMSELQKILEQMSGRLNRLWQNLFDYCTDDDASFSIATEAVGSGTS